MLTPNAVVLSFSLHRVIRPPTEHMGVSAQERCPKPACVRLPMYRYPPKCVIPPRAGGVGDVDSLLVGFAVSSSGV